MDPIGEGVICLRGKDEDCSDLIQSLSDKKLPYQSVWNWPHDSGILPADIYLRHCLLAVEKSSDPMAYISFRDETFLADRSTTLKEYLQDDEKYQQILDSSPPSHLATRFGG